MGHSSGSLGLRPIYSLLHFHESFANLDLVGTGVALIVLWVTIEILWLRYLGKNTFANLIANLLRMVLTTSEKLFYIKHLTRGFRSTPI